MFIRLLIIAVAVWLAIVALRRLRGSTPAPEKEMTHKGQMVVCQICGVYLPESEASAGDEGGFRCGRH